MANFLITSRSGAGKSTVCQELLSQGYTALDGDGVPGLARWIDADSGEEVVLDDMAIVDRSQYYWNWDESVLSELLEDDGDVFLCGSADNQLEFHALFDKVFVLIVDPQVQRQRLTQRTSHDYGKHPLMQDIIIEEQAEFVATALYLGAIAVDANPPINEVVDSILHKALHGQH